VAKLPRAEWSDEPLPPANGAVAVPDGRTTFLKIKKDKQKQNLSGISLFEGEQKKKEEKKGS
jgi:hypothetical protein